MLGIDLDADNSTVTGTGYRGTFTENGAAVPVVDTDISISQHAALGSELHGASIVLTNAQAGDGLLVGGSAAASGTYSAGGATFNYQVTSSGGAITVALSGTATLSQYQAALQAITFENASEAPSSVDRQISVSVSNATFNTTSNLALSTIHVVPVNDPPVATDDAITTPEDVAIAGTLPVRPTSTAIADLRGGWHGAVARHRRRQSRRQLRLHAGRRLQRPGQLHLHGERRHHLGRADRHRDGHPGQRRAGRDG
ncbi:MAG: hypothetical protein R3D33_07340 [Hyphomicrobiaceae bacterium]